MDKDKVIANLKKEVASKDVVIKAKDETISMQRQALKANE